MGSYRTCLLFTRKFGVTEAGPPLDVQEAFKKYTGDGPVMTLEQLRLYLEDSQGSTRTAITIADAEHILEQIHKFHHLIKLDRKTLTLDDFYHFLFSPDLNPPIGSQVHQDMSAPLSHYYIYTGHNSYLTGNQLSSKCSDVPIIEALKRGVRVIELDLWPNSSKKDIRVLHGRTLTRPIKLIKCLRSIKNHAFSASSYPLVITLEDHLKPDLQAIVAQMLTQTFGDMLFRPESETIKELPSPEKLKHHIIISTKPPEEYLEAKDSEDDIWGEEPSRLTAAAAKENDDKIESGSSDNSQDAADSEDQDPKLNHQSSSYKSLIAIHAGKPKGGLKDALIVEPDKVRRLSLSEQELEKAAEKQGRDLVRFTQKNILRTYPKGTRFNSSNYDPLIGWLHGAQMVAFNMQGYGKSLWLMQGMFRSNRGCGYVKKPEFLMNADRVFNPRAKLPVKKTLKVGIAGAHADEKMEKTETKVNNWAPVWNEEFEFPLTVPELALLRIEVHEHDVSGKDDFAGQTCLPVSELRSGIRAVPLCNRKGEKYNSVKLLMCFEFV